MSAPTAEELPAFPPDHSLWTESRGTGAGRRPGTTEPTLQQLYMEDAGTVSRDELLDLYARSFHPDWSGAVFLHLAPGHYVLDDSSRESSDHKKRGFHLSAYDMERRIPMLVYAPDDPAPGRYDQPVSLESVGATLFDQLGVPRPDGVTAPALALPDRPKPKLISVLVLDALPWWMWEHYLRELPNFTWLTMFGREYREARLDFMSSSTTVSHAVLSTGQPPARTGIPINHTRTKPGHYTEVFIDNEPHRLLVPTVADLYDAANDNQPVVVSFCSQSRAAIAMAGHGRDHPGGDADVVAWQQRYWGPMETNPAFYKPITYLREVDPDRYILELEDRQFLGRRLSDGRSLFRSPHNVVIGERAVAMMMEREGVGDDEITDLVFFNQKVLDNIGHRWGADTAEYKACMDELDAFIPRYIDLLHQHAGDDYLLIVTADHGFGPTLARPDEVTDPRRHERESLQASVEQRLDTQERPLIEDIQYLNVYLDEPAYEASGLGLDELCQAFTTEPWILDCLTRDEVLARQAEVLP